MTSEAELLHLLKRIRMDLSDAQSKLTEAMRALAALNLPEPDEIRCPTCGVKLRGPLSLAEHLYTSHDGPLPDHYAAAEKAAGINA